MYSAEVESIHPWQEVSNLIGEGYWINYHNVLFHSHSSTSQVAESVHCN
jgi:hypothetical protein